MGVIRHFPITRPASLIRLHPLGDDGFYAPVIDTIQEGLPRVRTTLRSDQSGLLPSGGVVAIGGTDEYRLAFVARRRGTLRVITRERARAVSPDSLWEMGVQPYGDQRERFSRVRCDPPVPERPPYLAAIRHILFYEQGRLWIEIPSESGFVWEVFDSEVRLFGDSEAPPRLAGIHPSRLERPPLPSRCG